MAEEVEPSEEALELIQDNGKDSQPTTTTVEEVILAAHEQQSRKFSTILTETAENISFAINNTFTALTGGSTEEDIR